jgi:lysophospholipase
LIGPGASPAEGSSTFSGARGTELFYRAVRPAEERAALILVHGLGEHSGRYERLSNTLVDAGIAVFALDLRGHGRSPGKRGHISGFSDFTSDLECFRRVVRREVAETFPIFLLGHSLGGLIAIRHLQRHPGGDWKGVILSAPALGIKMDVPRWKTIAGGMLARLAPSVSLNNGIDTANLSHDPAVIAAYHDDPFVHDRISAKLFSEMQEEADTAAEQMDSFATLPSLWLIPDDDRICNSNRALKSASRVAGTADIVVKRYPGAFHEVLNDSCGKEAAEDIRTWLAARC